MRQFLSIRHFFVKGGRAAAASVTAEVTCWDIVKILCGRELTIKADGCKFVIVRHARAYDALNMAAPIDRMLSLHTVTTVLPKDPCIIPMPAVKPTGGQKP